ncbi:MAG: hypothetical protein ACJ8NS_05760 [Chthoniobacterales bacterium]
MKLEFSGLMDLASRESYLEARRQGGWPTSDLPYADTNGYHIYSDLDFRLIVAAPENVDAAYLNLQILQAYASAADSVTSRSNIRLLEVQGQRLHMFREAEAATAIVTQEIVEACKAFYRVAVRHITALAPENAFAIRMAADYGRAILLRSGGDDPSESIISLGDPANRPAKKLARDVGRSGVPAGHLALNETAVTSQTAAPSWTLIDLRVARSQKSAEALEESAEQQYKLVSFSAMERLAQQFEPNPKNPVQSPRKRSGFMMRADLDGFSRQVHEALLAGNAGVAKLVHDFSTIMQYPAAFKDSLPEGVKVLLFPWAGDCANLLLECEEYAIERSYLPNRAALNWHDQGRGIATSGITWKGPMRGCKWVVAIAGGEHAAANHGFVLTGNIAAGGRTFHIGAGWSWRRSLDAEQSTSTPAEYTIIHNEDHTPLDPLLKPPYADHRDHPALFKIASFEALVKAQREHDKEAARSSAVTVASTGIQVKAARPYVRRISPNRDRRD